MHWQPNPLCHVIQITHDNIDLRVDINLVKTFDRYMQIFKIYLREKFGMFLAQKNTKYLGAFETNSFMHIYSNVDITLVI